VNAPRSLKKRSIGVVSKVARGSRKSGFPGIGKKHFSVYVKFEVRVSILFTRKMRSKKKGAFCKVCPFFKWRV
jgi:hypothetical protein